MPFEHEPPAQAGGFFYPERNCALSDAVRKRLALDQFHPEVVRADFVQRASVGIIERRDCAGLALKVFTEILLGNLDRHNAPQSRIHGAISRSDAAFADGFYDLVGPKFVTRS